jgi:acyl carrier protein
MTDFNAIDTKIRAVLKDHAKIIPDALTLDPNMDLYLSGMTSLSSVNVMLGLEGAFDIEFPDHMLNKKVFGCITSIRAALLELTAMA